MNFTFAVKNSTKAETCTLVHIWSDLGESLEVSKLEGLTFLGIEINSITIQARLPLEKLSGKQHELRLAINILLVAIWAAAICHMAMQAFP